MNVTRVIGNNVQLELMNQNLNPADVRSCLGYSEEEFNRLMEGRLFVSPKEIAAIAGQLEMTSEELMRERACVQYRELIHNMGQSNDAAVIEQVLDFFDMYADLKDAVICSR